MKLTFDKYRQWEKEKEEFKKVGEKYKKANEASEAIIAFNEKFNAAYQELEKENEIDTLLQLLKSGLPSISGNNFNYDILYFERVLCEYPMNEEIWTLYLEYLFEKCRTHDVRLKIMSKSLKSMYDKPHFWLLYMREEERKGKTSTEIYGTSLGFMK